MFLLVTPDQLETGLNKGYKGCPQPRCQASFLPWLCTSQALTSSTSDSRRWPENPRLLCRHQAVTRPVPWPPGAPQSSCPPAGTAGANYFLLLAAGCGFTPLFCEEEWGCSKAEKSQALRSEIWQGWVCDHWKRPKATCGCHHRQTAAVKWRSPVWTSWQRYRSDINRSDIACKWELHFPH